VLLKYTSAKVSDPAAASSRLEGFCALFLPVRGAAGTRLEDREAAGTSVTGSA